MMSEHPATPATNSQELVPQSGHEKLRPRLEEQPSELRVIIYQSLLLDILKDGRPSDMLGLLCSCKRISSEFQHEIKKVQVFLEAWSLRFILDPVCFSDCSGGHKYHDLYLTHLHVNFELSRAIFTKNPKSDLVITLRPVWEHEDNQVQTERPPALLYLEDIPIRPILCEPWHTVTIKYIDDEPHDPRHRRSWVDFDVYAWLLMNHGRELNFCCTSRLVLTSKTYHKDKRQYREWPPTYTYHELPAAQCYAEILRLARGHVRRLRRGYLTREQTRWHFVRPTTYGYEETQWEYVFDFEPDLELPQNLVTVILKHENLWLAGMLPRQQSWNDECILQIDGQPSRDAMFLPLLDGNADDPWHY